ncbi:MULTISPECIES: prolipoprotein diacylglyceryl transferase [unclassified Adlercreutzia]|uniref:prolipoprotein diacylglyceryl transferase n=1 Tax=unclassified Adlercreutzia TaxID=2636013 RepID=UPI0013EBD4BC|nr:MULTISPECIES: prolipoprotein diacylglyceryl transferase [unclassified Adlercreutzia]
MLNALYHAIDPIAFQIGPIAVRWYGIAYVLGFALAGFLIYRTAKHWKLNFTIEDILTIMLCVMIGIIVGARLGYCLFYGEGYYFTHPLDILAVNQGGMSFHGGLIGALLAGIVVAKITHIPYLTLADLGVIAAPLGLFFGRFANFINGELWGAPTDLAIGVVFGGAAGNIPRHPTQLYEGVLEGLVIFIVLFALSRKLPPRPRGTFLGCFLVMYGVFRFLIEFVRQPDIHLGYIFGGWLTMGQILSVPLILAGVIFLVYARKKQLAQLGSQGMPEESEEAA